MPSLNTQEQIWARDDKGMKHAVTVTRAPMPGSPHLQGLLRYSWGAGRPLNLIDGMAGILECASTKQRLNIEEWAAVFRQCLRDASRPDNRRCKSSMRLSSDGLERIAAVALRHYDQRAEKFWEASHDAVTLATSHGTDLPRPTWRCRCEAWTSLMPMDFNERPTKWEASQTRRWRWR